MAIQFMPSDEKGPDEIFFGSLGRGFSVMSSIGMVQKQIEAQNLSNQLAEAELQFNQSTAGIRQQLLERQSDLIQANTNQANASAFLTNERAEQVRPLAENEIKTGEVNRQRTMQIIDMGEATKDTAIAMMNAGNQAKEQDFLNLLAQRQHDAETGVPILNSEVYRQQQIAAGHEAGVMTSLFRDPRYLESLIEGTQAAKLGNRRTRAQTKLIQAQIRGINKEIEQYEKQSGIQMESVIKELYDAGEIDAAISLMTLNLHFDSDGNPDLQAIQSSLRDALDIHRNLTNPGASGASGAEQKPKDRKMTGSEREQEASRFADGLLDNWKYPRRSDWLDQISGKGDSTWVGEAWRGLTNQDSDTIVAFDKALGFTGENLGRGVSTEDVLRGRMNQIVIWLPTSMSGKSAYESLFGDFKHQAPLDVRALMFHSFHDAVGRATDPKVAADAFRMAVKSRTTTIDENGKSVQKYKTTEIEDWVSRVRKTIQKAQR